MYFNLLAPFIGGVYFFKNKKINKDFIPLFCMVVIGLISVLNLPDYSRFISILRLTQLVLFFFFSMWLCTEFKSEDPIVLCKLIFYLILIVFFIEIIFIGNHGYRNFFGISLPRYRGVVGEPNFTALLLLGLSLIFLFYKCYMYAFLASVLIFLTANRSSFLSLFLFIALFFCYNKINKKLSFFMVMLCLVTIFIYPFILLFIDQYLSLDTQIFLNRISSLRYYLHLYYTDVGIKNWMFGVGYFNGKSFITIQELVSYGLIDKDVKLEQHNTFLQIFSEFGIFGYALFCMFFVNILKKSLAIDYSLFLSFSCFLFSLLFVNALHEPILYIYISLILSKCHLLSLKK